MTVMLWRTAGLLTLRKSRYGYGRDRDEAAPRVESPEGENPLGSVFDRAPAADHAQAQGMAYKAYFISTVRWLLVPVSRYLTWFKLGPN
jgi:hypothetical protein